MKNLSLTISFVLKVEGEDRFLTLVIISGLLVPPATSVSSAAPCFRTSTWPHSAAPEFPSSGPRTLDWRVPATQESVTRTQMIPPSLVLPTVPVTAVSSQFVPEISFNPDHLLI